MDSVEKQDAEMVLWVTTGETPFGEDARLFRADNPENMDAALREKYGPPEELDEDGVYAVALVAAMREYSPADYPVTVGVYN